MNHRRRNFFRQYTAIILTLVLFFIGALITKGYLSKQKGEWEKDVRNQLLEVLVGKRSTLENELYSRIYYTKSIAAYVSLHPELSLDEYDNLAAELIGQDSVICTMSLSKDCIIGSVYPIKGHEEAIGLNLLEHPKRREIVEKTIETHNTFVAGPLELVEGGMAFVSYTPIFDKTKGNDDDFWGVTDIVIYQDFLLQAAGLKENENGFNYALKGNDGQGDKGMVFFGSEDVFRSSPVTVSIDLPYGKWILAVCPEKGWRHYSDQDRTLLFVLIFSILIISILAGLFANAILKIKQKEGKFSAIFNSMDNLVFQFDRNGIYMDIAPTKPELLVAPPNELLHKSIYDFLEESDAREFHKAILQCLDERKLVIYEYSILINGIEKWFSARFSWLSEDYVISQVYDITVQRKSLEELALSEQHLRDTNASKDKLFSIIAHDLRSPVSTVYSYSHLLFSDNDELSDEERKQYINAIYQGANQTIVLIDNLLAWSQSQRGNIAFSPEKVNIHDAISDALAIYHETARKKKIVLNTDIGNVNFVSADTNMLAAILRNLISNAIKYSYENEAVTIVAKPIENESGKKLVEIAVIDHGVGMNTKEVTTLFDIGQSESKPGTDNESGTGLGLLLCKEFIHRHNHNLRVESEEGKGSRFIFCLDQYLSK